MAVAMTASQAQEPAEARVSTRATFESLIVDADADLNAAADAAAWGALSNAGQTCVGIERVYVADPVYETFLAKLADRVSRLRPGSDDGADYGPMTMPGQIDVARRHLADAVTHGGRTLPGSAGG